MSYGAAGDLLGELFPTGRRVHRNEISRTVAAVAGRLAAELAHDQPFAIDPLATLPAGVPDMPLVVAQGVRPDQPVTFITDGADDAATRL